MKYQQLNSLTDQNIPVYDMGDGTPCNSPIVICRYDQNTRGMAPLHRHRTFQINYVVRGNLLHTVNRVNYPLVTGDLFVIPPFVPHQLKAEKENDYEIVELEFIPQEVFGIASTDASAGIPESSIYDDSYIKPFVVDENQVRPRLNMIGRNQMVVEAILDDMLHELHAKSKGYQLALKADLSKLLVIAERSCEDPRPEEQLQLFDHHQEAITRTIAYMDQHFDEQITLEDASRMATMSPSYFSYLFKLMTNKTFVEYLHDIRLKEALLLLKTTDDQILNICYRCGFNSINYFNRIFKQEIGSAPREYRQLSRSLKPSKHFPPNEPQGLLTASV